MEHDSVPADNGPDYSPGKQASAAPVEPSAMEADKASKSLPGFSAAAAGDAGKPNADDSHMPTPVANKTVQQLVRAAAHQVQLL